jgi:hypothetical protein
MNVAAGFVLSAADNAAYIAQQELMEWLFP